MTEQQKKAVDADVKDYLYQFVFDNGDQEAEVKEHYTEGLKEVINHPERYGLQPISEWVSVKDRLPDVGEEFNLVQDIQDGLGGPVATCGEWNAIKKRFEYIGTEVEISKVTHWQPLPQPPINERGEG